MTSSQHGLYILGYTHATMAGTMGSEGAIRSESSKTGPSSDCRLQQFRLQAATRLHEDGVASKRRSAILR